MTQSTSILELEKAVQTLGQALDFAEQSKNNEIQYKIARDACIQRFEYCIELSWKVSVKKLGSLTKFAKAAVREMARGDLIDDAVLWLEFIDARNSTSHSYDENTARKVFEVIKRFHPESLKLIERLSRLP